MKHFLKSKFVRTVSGVQVNYLTLEIYDEKVRQEYKEHINIF